MATYLQAIEFTTSRIHEVEALIRERRGQADSSRIRGTVTACRNRPGTYFTLVETGSAESAVRNLSHPEAATLVAEMSELCDQPPTIYSLTSTPHPDLPASQRSAPEAGSWWMPGLPMT